MGLIRRIRVAGAAVLVISGGFFLVLGMVRLLSAGAANGVGMVSLFFVASLAVLMGVSEVKSSRSG
jgi:hypothetical protein